MCCTVHTYLKKGNHILYLYGVCEYDRWVFYANYAGMADSQAHTLTFYNYKHWKRRGRQPGECRSDWL